VNRKQQKTLSIEIQQVIKSTSDFSKPEEKPEVLSLSNKSHQVNP